MLYKSRERCLVLLDVPTKTEFRSTYLAETETRPPPLVLHAPFISRFCPLSRHVSSGGT